jgi:hypothetical protein
VVGIYYELHHSTEESSCGGMLSFTTYGPTEAQTKSWADKQAWDFIHENRPTRRTLDSLKSAPVADYLLTDQGPQPLLFEEIRKLNEDRNFDDLLPFGIGASGYIGHSKEAGAKADVPSAFLEPRNLEKLRAETERHMSKDELVQERYVRQINWDPGEQALYLFTVFGPNREECQEAVFCRAVNFHHAAVIWHWHCSKESNALRDATFSLAHGFCAVGQPLFPWRRKRKN